jgi:hypothetical protein
VYRRVLLLGLTGTSALVLAASISAAAPGWRIIGHASASGNLAGVAASATADRPAEIAVRVTAGRGGSVSGTAVVACGKGYHGTASATTRFSGRSSLFRVVRLPLRTESCDVVADASSTSGGRLVVQILER